MSETQFDIENGKKWFYLYVFYAYIKLNSFITFVANLEHQSHMVDGIEIDVPIIQIEIDVSCKAQTKKRHLNKDGGGST